MPYATRYCYDAALMRYAMLREQAADMLFATRYVAADVDAMLMPYATRY